MDDGVPLPRATPTAQAGGSTRSLPLALQTGTRQNQLLLAGLIVVLAILIGRALIGTILAAPRFGNDLEISLRAGERWLSGASVYLPTFSAGPGAVQPFLYPPYTLPLISVLTAIPREIIIPVWVGVMFLAAVFACRLLEIPWPWVIPVLLWPPFAEGIVAANIQIILFAAFIALFFARSGTPWIARQRDLADPSESAARMGSLATRVGAIKISQPHPWLYVLRRRPLAAVAGAGVALILVLITLPMTGINLWFEWVGQLRLASDPTWDLGGIALSRFVPPGVGLAIAGLSVVAVWFVPKRDAASWIGVLSVIGTLSLHTFGMLFLVPAMLVIRRELALLAAICIATYSYEGSWAGIMICVVAFVASRRYPVLLWRGASRSVAD